MSNSNQGIQEWIDKAQIHDAMMRYSRGVDRCDPDLIATAFHEGAMDDHGDGLKPITVLLENIKKSLSSRAMMHFIGNEFVEFESDDVAFSETYFISYATVDVDGKPTTRSRGGRYLDRLERRDGVWGITIRTVVDEWSRLDTVVTPGLPAEMHFNRGERSRDDLVYHLSEIHA